MKNFKKKWEIQHNWQLIFPFLGILGLLFSAYILHRSFFSATLHSMSFSTKLVTTIASTLLVTYLLLQITLWLFKKLKNRWQVNYRFEFITIFIVFALTGSSSARLSDPFLQMIGIDESATNAVIFWILRILLIFPIYQVLLVAFGWLFGQFSFFWAFEKKMLKRLGFKKFFNE
jgi:hypothetical protein